MFSSYMCIVDHNVELSDHDIVGYDPNERPIIRSGFSVAALRVGHSLIYHSVLAHNGAAPTANNLLRVNRLL